MIFIWIKFIVCTILILFAGKKIAKHGDVIAEKSGLGGLWTGLLLLAVATSLPEIFTGVGSIIFVGDPNLTGGNIFGANSYNLLNIAVLDFLNKEGPLLSMMSAGQLLTAWFSLVPLVIAGLGIFLSNAFSIPDIANISIFSILILASYILLTRKIFIFEKSQKKNANPKIKYKDATLKNAILFYCISAFVIILAGIWLAYIGDELAKALRLNSSFVGNLFLGFTTTLPEIVVSIAALRLGAKEMAVANLLGSNLFNVTIFFINDLLYRKEAIFAALSLSHLFTCFKVIIMTLVVILAMILKPKRKTVMNLSWPTIILLIIFSIGAYMNFATAELNILVIDDFEGEMSLATVDYGSGGGSTIQISGSKDTKYHGEQALRLEYDSVSGGYMWAGRGSALDVKGADQWLRKPEKIDWSKYNALSFYMYGKNSGASIAVDIIDSGFEYFRFMVKDDFDGWKQVICPFKEFFTRGDWQPDKAQTNAELDFPVNAFQFEPRTIAKGTLYLDYVHLLKKD
ncbi:MAG: carbohydrate binding domain-containing protein [Candidatus Omnitrophota bacterium]